MSDRDPLRDAVTGGNEACPDGRALANLGRLVREAGRPEREPRLEGAVLDRIAHLPADADPIDDYYRDGQGDPTITALAELVREAGRPPQPVDLKARVRAAIQRSGRLTSADAAGSRSRLRIWHMVVAGHLAALVALAIITVEPGRSPEDQAAVQGPRTAGGTTGQATVAPPEVERSGQIPLPASWMTASSERCDLLLPRKFPEIRQSYRRDAGMPSADAPVSAGLRWLMSRQDRQGLFTIGDPAANDQALAAQASAILALLGEGLGDAGRTKAVRRGLDRMLAAWTPGRRTAEADGLATLAVVEGALLLGDSALDQAALRALAASPRPLTTGAGGVGGFRLLAIRTAVATGMPVEAGLAAEAEAVLTAAKGSAHPTVAALGRWAALTRGEGLPRPAQATLPETDANGRIDPLSWFFPTLADHAFGGSVWAAWSVDLSASLGRAMADGHVGAGRAAHLDGPDGDVTATAFAVLCLQVPYRYLPVR
jgi:hypothetical protein